MCFNALLRASFFSTKSLLKIIEGTRMFQCPTSGFFLFYNFLSLIKGEKNEKFQCPTSGFFLFYAMSLHSLILLAFQPPFCK